MTVISKLSTTQSEVANVELAKQIVEANDKKAIRELIDNLNHKDKRIQGSCIKALYEIGERKPDLIAGYAKEFIALLDSKNNRLQWGAMTALGTIASLNPEPIYAALGKIVETADKGTVITRDHCVGILVKLCAYSQFRDDCLALLIEMIQSSPVNQLPTYAERTMPYVNAQNKARFVKVLTSRLGDIETDTKRKRVEKVIKKVG